MIIVCIALEATLTIAVLHGFMVLTQVRFESTPQIYLFILILSVFWGIKLYTLEHTYVTASSSSKEEEKNVNLGAGGMAQPLRTLGVLAGDPGLEPSINLAAKNCDSSFGASDTFFQPPWVARTHAQTQERRINEIQEGFQELERGKERLKLKIWRYSPSQLERVGKGDMFSVSSWPRDWAQAPIFDKQASPRQNKKPHFSWFVTYFLHWKH